MFSNKTFWSSAIKALNTAKQLKGQDSKKPKKSSSFPMSTAVNKVVKDYTNSASAASLKIGGNRKTYKSPMSTAINKVVKDYTNKKTTKKPTSKKVGKTIANKIAPGIAAINI